MPLTDPISDMLTRIRNAQRVGHDSLSLPASKLKKRIADVLASEGYLREVSFKDDGAQGEITIALKYDSDKSPAISEVRRVSRPGRRVYVAVADIPRVKNGLGIAILSTSKGVIVDREARKSRLGGELLCTVW
jgi:small subunit ribosomal protein S8